MARQAILTRDDPPPPRVWAVLDQQVLTRNIGGAAVMFGQMEHLAELARRPEDHDSGDSRLIVPIQGCLGRS